MGGLASCLAAVPRWLEADGQHWPQAVGRGARGLGQPAPGRAEQGSGRLAAHWVVHRHHRG